MDYIYAKLDNGLVNINQIEYIKLKRCGKEGFPLNHFKIGDFYLETKIIKSDLLTYTDMSSLNKENAIITNKIEEEVKNRIEALNKEEARTNAMINQLNENIHSQFVSLNKIVIDAINTINGGIEEERQIRAQNDADIREKLANETSRTNEMINQVNENINYIVNELNNNIISIVNVINENLRQETETRALEDNNIRENLNQEIQNREESIANEQSLREAEDVKINARIDELTSHTDTSIQELDNKLTNALNIERQERISADTLLTDNLNKEIADRTDAINNEKKLREAADKVLTDNLNKEIEDRQNAITKLDNSFTQKLNEEISNRELAITNLDNKLTSAIEKETQARQTADNTLTTNLNKEIQAREKAITDLDTKLTASLSAETTAREEADNALTERITNEVSTLNSTISTLDTKLTNAITKETTDRIADVNNARQEATTKIEEEKQARELADNNLTKSLEKEKADRTTADNDLSRRVDNLEGKTTRLFYGEGTLTSPNATEIQAFIDGLEVDPPYTAPYSGIAIVVHITTEDTNHIWHYYDNLKNWRDDGIDTVSTFTNTTRGIIQGSNKVGYISASNGFGKVNGWEELNNKVTTEITDRENAINNLNQTLTNAINEEVRVRQEQDTNLNNLINQEKTDRQNANNLLTEKINKEITDRESAINNLSQALNSDINEEARVRQEQDDNLSTSLTKEIADREVADTTLNEKINKEIDSIKKEISNLGSISNLEFEDLGEI